MSMAATTVSVLYCCLERESECCVQATQALLQRPARPAALQHRARPFSSPAPAQASGAYTATFKHQCNQLLERQSDCCKLKSNLIQHLGSFISE